MTDSRRLAGAFALALFWTTPAAASVPHTVESGETLWSIAAESNLTPRALAAANGLPETAQVFAGRTIQIPSEAEATAALGSPDSLGAGGVEGSSASAAGTYTVAPGDTLSGIAARSGMTPEQVAAMNGLAPDAHVISGSLLTVGGDVAAEPERVTAEEVGRVASAHGVSPSLAAAIAWQESGFNNGLVSSADARGVMQVVPDTWSWVEGSLLGRRIDRSSPEDNLHVGVLYLGQLIQDAGGDEARAVAGYYQGPASVSQIGLLPETEQYVANVMALRSRFGG